MKHEPAPYTRETLELMRKGATASDLGWMPAFYDGVCNRHQIKRVAPPRQPAVVPTKPASDVAATIHDPILWDVKSRELNRSRYKIALTGRMAKLFDILYRVYLQNPKDGTVSGVTLATSLGIYGQGSIANIAKSFNRRAAPLNLAIKGRMQRPSGYRLIDLCSVASVSVNNPKQED